MEFCILGLSFGLSAGIAPGPLMALAIDRSLRGGFLSGLRVSVAPLITDLPIVTLAIWLAGRIPESALAVVMAMGGLFVLWLGVDAWRRPGIGGLEIPSPRSPWRDLAHGAVVNLLNPHPYMFWAIVGAPTVVRAWRDHPSGAVGFVVGFYLLLIGAKIVLAALVARARGFSPRRYCIMSRASAVMLIAAAAYMIITAARDLARLTG